MPNCETQFQRKLALRPASQVDLSIIIVNYNTKVEIATCLASLYGQDHGLAIEVIVVDNRSSDGSVEAIRTQFPESLVVEAERNGGFSYGNNIGMERAQGRFFLLLNPDTAVPSGVLSTVVKKLESDRAIGVVGVAQKTSVDRLESSALRVLRPWHLLMLSIFPKSLAARISPSLQLHYGDRDVSADFQAEALTGCFLAMRREVIEKVGGLDERIFMYGEEMEFCWRVRQAGLRNLYMGSLHIEHAHGASTRDLSLWRDVQMQSGQLLCIRFTQGILAARLAALAMTFSHFLRLPIELATHRSLKSERVRSRAKRLRRSFTSIFRVPDHSEQKID